MNSNSRKLGLWLSGVFLILCFFAILSFAKNGEVLRTMRGEVQKCEALGEGKMGSLTHATIKSETGSYIIASLIGCRPGAEVTIVIKRGALYFNIVYAAEKA